VARLLDGWPLEMFQQWGMEGQRAELMLAVGHGDGRFDVDVSSHLIAACVRLGLGLRINVATHDDWFPP